MTESDISKQSKWRVLYMSFEGPECNINKLKRNKVAELSNMEVKT